MQPAALAASGAALAYVTPSHQFPTGATMPVGRRTRLLQWAAQREGRFIIEDDYDSEFRLDGRPLPAMQSLGPQQVIYIGTFSRGIAPAVRIGYLVLPPALLGAFFSRFGFYSCTVGRIEQQTLCRFLETGQYARHQARLRAAYRRKRDAVCAALLEALAPFSPRIENAHTGLHFVLRLACPCTGKALAGAMRRHGVLACPLSAYFHTGRCSEAGPALVLGFGAWPSRISGRPHRPWHARPKRHAHSTAEAGRSSSMAAFSQAKTTPRGRVPCHGVCFSKYYSVFRTIRVFPRGAPALRKQDIPQQNPITPP